MLYISLEFIGNGFLLEKTILKFMQIRSHDLIIYAQFREKNGIFKHFFTKFATFFKNHQQYRKVINYEFEVYPLNN